MDIVNILGWLVIGLIVGALARFLVPGRDPMGCLGTSLVGVAGAFVGGMLANAFYHRPWMPAFFHNPWMHGPYAHYYARPGFLISLVGAVVVVLIVRMLRGRSS
jgi:uncharacterized membrane protein YeaQ/YmgE (transglycosylase-associated protein family)